MLDPKNKGRNWSSISRLGCRVHLIRYDKEQGYSVGIKYLDLDDKISEYRFQWYQHLDRLDESRILLQAFTYKPIRKRMLDEFESDGQVSLIHESEQVFWFKSWNQWRRWWWLFVQLPTTRYLYDSWARKIRRSKYCQNVIACQLTCAAKWLSLLSSSSIGLLLTADPISCVVTLTSRLILICFLG